MIEAVIDSVQMNSALRPPKPSRKSARSTKDAITPLDRPIKLRKLRLALDASQGLQSEWVRTCGLPAIQDFVVYCEQYDGIHFIQNPVNPSSDNSRRLRILGFGNDTVDKLILRIALATQDRIIVSGESDFWDPKKPTDRNIRGCPNAPVARFLKDQLGVTVLLLGALIAKVD